MLAVIFFPVVATFPWWWLLERKRFKRVGDEEWAVRTWWLKMLVHQLEVAGPFFIKVRNNRHVPQNMDAS